MKTYDSLERIKKIKRELEQADQEVTKARIKKDKKLKELTRINEELYKQNVQLVNKLKDCEEK